MIKKYVFFFLVLPLTAFSQNVLVKNLHPIGKHNHSTDTIKSISYPVIYTDNGIPCKRINNIIRALVFGIRESDTTQRLQNLLNNTYAKHKGINISYKTYHTTNGFLSLTITVVPSGGDKHAPMYLNFDLTTGELITLRDMLNTRNDSISFRQAVVPQITDSVRLFEQALDKTNPVKHSKIIEELNKSLSNFRENYLSDFILTDMEIKVRYDCILPKDLESYDRTYQVSFRYRALKNILKPGIVQRLQ